MSRRHHGDANAYGARIQSQRSDHGEVHSRSYNARAGVKRTMLQPWNGRPDCPHPRWRPWHPFLPLKP